MSEGDGGARAARAVAEIAREEHELVDAGRVDDLDELHDRRTAAMAQLPAELSDEARASLREALELQASISEALQIAVALTGAELGRVAQGRTAMRGYAPAGMEPVRALDRSV